MAEVDHNTLAVIMSLVGVLFGGGSIVAFFRLNPQNRKDEADTTRVITEMWETLYKTLERRVAELEESRAELEDELKDLYKWIKEQGLTPPPRPIKKRRTTDAEPAP